LLIGIPREAVHRELPAHLQLSNRQVISGEEGESHSNLLACGKGLTGGFLLAESGIPQPAIGQEGIISDDYLFQQSSLLVVFYFISSSLE
jgi:hypothetical protein